MITVELLHAGNGRAYASLRGLQFQEHPERRPSPELLVERNHLAHDANGLVQHYIENHTTLWGAYDRNLLVGTLGSSRRFSKRMGCYLWLWGLFVRTAYRGTPASRSLMATVLGRSDPQRSAERVFGAYDAENLHARRFVERYGYAPADGANKMLGLWFKRPGDIIVEFTR